MDVNKTNQLNSELHITSCHHCLSCITM